MENTVSNVSLNKNFHSTILYSVLWSMKFPSANNFFRHKRNTLIYLQPNLQQSSARLRSFLCSPSFSFAHWSAARSSSWPTALPSPCHNQDALVACTWAALEVGEGIYRSFGLELTRNLPTGFLQALVVVDKPRKCKKLCSWITQLEFCSWITQLEFCSWITQLEFCLWITQLEFGSWITQLS